MTITCTFGPWSGIEATALEYDLDGYILIDVDRLEWFNEALRKVNDRKWMDASVETAMRSNALLRHLMGVK